MNPKRSTSRLTRFEMRIDKSNSRTRMPVFIQFGKEYATGKRENSVVVNPADLLPKN